MIIQGLLKLHGAATGTVALVEDTSLSVLDVATTEPTGRFDIETAAEPAGATLYGFPGITLNAAQVAEALKHPTGAVYQAEAPTTPFAGKPVYVNVASSCVREMRRNHPTLNTEQASAQLKAHLIGAGAAKLSPGYTTEFIIHVAEPRVFSEQQFNAATTAAGGLESWVSQLSQAGAKAPGKAPFVERHGASGGVQLRTKTEPTTGGVDMLTSRPSSQPPSVPSSLPEGEAWASDDTTWMDVLSAEDNAYADSMEAVADTTDGIAASVLDDGFEFSIADVAAWTAKNLGAGAVAAIGGQLFSMVESWVIGKGANPVASALAQISSQLTTLINNQITIDDGISEILDEIAAIDESITANAMVKAIATIQTNMQAANELTSTKTGADASDLAAAILDTDTGVTNALQVIHDAILGVGATTSLSSAALQCATAPVQDVARKFFSNGNCFAPAQWLFHYYSIIQVQGVQLVIQAHNFNANQSVNDPNTPFTVNDKAVTAYNTWLIGGAGASKLPPNLEQQRNQYRAAYWAYFHSAQGYLGTLPADMAVGLIPRIAGQCVSVIDPTTNCPTAVEVFFNPDANLLALGHISGKLRKWTSGTDVLSINSGLVGTPWVLPPKLSWRYPDPGDFEQMFASAGKLPRYSSNRFQLFIDQGFNDDSSDYPNGLTLNALFSRHSAFWGDAWLGTTQDSNANPVPQNPSDINGNVIDYVTGNGPTGSYEFWWSGTWPSGYQSDGSQTFFSSNCYNIYQRSDPSSAWSSWPFFGISGGIVVADTIGYLPGGSYKESCKDIKITLTCTAQKDDGTTTPASIDLTRHANVALANHNGELSISNPFAPPPGDQSKFVPKDRTMFVPPGTYKNNCTDIKVAISCQLQLPDGSYQPSSFDLTDQAIGGIALANTNGTLTG